MSLFTILSDSREQKPWTFGDYPVETKTVTLRTGDYTLERFCDYDAENDTYVPNLAVERKSGQDFLSSITQRRDAFKREIKRAGDWNVPLRVVISEPWASFQNRYSDLLKYRKIWPNQIEGTVREWGEHYNVTFDFEDTRALGEQKAFDYLMGWHRFR